MYGINVNIIKKHLQDVKAITIAAGNFIAIILPAIIVLMLTNFFEKVDFNNSDFTMSMVYIVILSAFGTALAKVLFNELVKMATPVFASSVTYLMPVVAIGWGVFDDEGFSFWQVVATILILVGVYLANRKN
jgi:drug/metabolite transporter (DMT)-like permease